MSRASSYIEAFSRGEGFSPPSQGLIIDGRPDEAALDLLERELVSGAPDVRESIVALLVDVGLRTDPLQPEGAEVLRNPRIIEILARAARHDRPDLGREAAASALRKLVIAADLAPFGDGFVHTLATAPSEELFLLVAKAKPALAQPVVEQLIRAPEWKGVEAARIAYAALGGEAVEDDFLRVATEAERASDGEGLARALGPLALMGTPRSLRAIAERLRTPLTISIPGAFEKSVRLNVLDALLYNFPDHPELYPNNINDESDYTMAERFCTKALGVTYDQPPPPFLTYRGAPIPMITP